MFIIYSAEENGNSYTILENEHKTTRAKISLNEGARIISLKVRDVVIIEDDENFEYKDSYASSLLFPFASRVENAKYIFLGREYELEKNDKNIGALHGLVYNKTFSMIEPEQDEKMCSATFHYYENNRAKGFPFKYVFSVTYTLTNEGLKIKVSIKNIDDKHFPFTIGWHPYFKTSFLDESSLIFNAHKRVVFNENLITKDYLDVKQKGEFSLKDKTLDDCFFLDDNKVMFNCPEYNLEITTDKAVNFLQMFTPPQRTSIAIEPMTGISNSLNNKVGIQVLEPNNSYSISWNVKVLVSN